MNGQFWVLEGEMSDKARGNIAGMHQAAFLHRCSGETAPYVT